MLLGPTNKVQTHVSQLRGRVSSQHLQAQQGYTCAVQILGFHKDVTDAVQSSCFGAMFQRMLKKGSLRHKYRWVSFEQGVS
jgi:hypothetical protein